MHLLLKINIHLKRCLLNVIPHDQAFVLIFNKKLPSSAKNVI
jgi:hypothetical protein